MEKLKYCIDVFAMWFWFLPGLFLKIYLFIRKAHLHREREVWTEWDRQHRFMHLGHLALFHQPHSERAGLQVHWLVLERVLIWDAGIDGGRLTDCTRMVGSLLYSYAHLALNKTPQHSLGASFKLGSVLCFRMAKNQSLWLCFYSFMVCKILSFLPPCSSSLSLTYTHGKIHMHTYK